MSSDLQEFISRVPPAEQIRERIQQRLKEVTFLRSLLRAAVRGEQVKSQSPDRREVASGHAR